MTTKSATPTKKKSARKTPLPKADDIAARAYRLFLERGGQHGHDCEDWLQAERELRSAQLPHGATGLR